MVERWRKAEREEVIGRLGRDAGDGEGERGGAGKATRKPLKRRKFKARKGERKRGETEKCK